jgi:hypothetical protein
MSGLDMPALEGWRSAVWSKDATNIVIDEIKARLESRTTPVYLEMLDPVYIVVKFDDSYLFSTETRKEVATQFLESFKSIRGTDDVAVTLFEAPVKGIAFQLGPEVSVCPHVEIHVNDTYKGFTFLDTVKNESLMTRLASKTMMMF